MAYCKSKTSRFENRCCEEIVEQKIIVMIKLVYFFIFTIYTKKIYFSGGSVILRRGEILSQIKSGLLIFF